MEINYLHKVGYNPKTQKARGVKALIPMTNGQWYHVSGLQLIPEELNETWETLIGYYGSKIFARPCPRTPRHGFVESRVITSPSELEAILKEAYAADPRGEMLYTRQIDASFSAVVTDCSLTLGPGNDGATAGKASVTLPIACNIRNWVDKWHLTISDYKTIRPSLYAGLKPQSRMPFVEFVNGVPVQLRYGPKLEGYTGDWIPPGGTSASVMLRAGCMPSDMMALEQYLKVKLNEHDASDLAVYAPGHSLSSHLAIQCISHNIAFFTTQDPKPTVRVETLQDTHKPVTIRKALLAHLQWDRANINEAIATIQAIAGTPANDQRTALIYGASELLLKAAIGACIGEHRYYHPEEIDQLPYVPVTAAMKPAAFPNKGFSRSAFYTQALRTNLRDYKKSMLYLGRLVAVEADFDQQLWPSNFGGPKWARCTQATINALKAWLLLHAYSQYDTGGYIKEYNLQSVVNSLIAAINILINVSHNNGRCLTKFTSTETLNAITLFPAKYLVTEFMYNLLQSMNQLEVPHDTTKV